MVGKQHQSKTLEPFSPDGGPNWLLVFLLILSFSFTTWALLNIFLSNDTKSQTQTQHWRAPDGKPIPIVQAQKAHYSSIEDLFKSHYQNEQNDLHIDHSLLLTLRKIMALLPKDQDRNSLEDLGRKLAEAFAGGQGKQMSLLLEDYYHYAQNPESTASNTDISTRMRYQEEIFGGQTAQALFGKENAFHQYLFDRRQISSDQNMSADKKREALRELENQFNARKN